MKKTVRIFSLVLILTLLLSTVPMAKAAVTVKGSRFNVENWVGEATDLVLGSEYITSLTYRDERIVAGEPYAIFVVKLNEDGSYTLTEASLYYIYQETAETGEVTFTNVYPKSLANSVILIAGKGLDAKGTLVGKIKVNFKYGDVNNDTRITGGDAMLVAQYVVGALPENATFIEMAAKVSKDDRITGGDAMLIAQYVVGDIPNFPIEE